MNHISCVVAAGGTNPRNGTALATPYGASTSALLSASSSSRPRRSSAWDASRAVNSLGFHPGSCWSARASPVEMSRSSSCEETRGNGRRAAFGCDFHRGMGCTAVSCHGRARVRAEWCHGCFPARCSAARTKSDESEPTSKPKKVHTQRRYRRHEGRLNKRRAEVGIALDDDAKTAKSRKGCVPERRKQNKGATNETPPRTNSALQHCLHSVDSERTSWGEEVVGDVTDLGEPSQRCQTAQWGGTCPAAPPPAPAATRQAQPQSARLEPARHGQHRPATAPANRTCREWRARVSVE